MKKLLYGLLALLLLGQVNAYSQQSKSPPPRLSLTGEKVEFSKQKLEKSFSAYDLYQVDFTELKKRAKENDLFEAKLKLGDSQQWNLLLLYHDMRASDFKETVPTGDGGYLKMPKHRANTFKGYINNPGSLGEPIRLNIDENFVNGFVTIKGEEHFIEPLTFTHPDAPEDYFIVYKGDDVIGDAREACTYGMAEGNNPYGEGEIEFDQKQHGIAGDCFEVELVTACTWDYVAFFGGPGAANGQITAVTNIVEGLFAPFVLEYIIVEQFAPASAAADPFTASTIAEDILDSFRAFATGMAGHDLGQIWTRHDIRGCCFPNPCPPGVNNFGLIGCANCLGCVCEELRYNVCEHFNGSTMNQLGGLSAHEFGHNWGGLHVGTSTIMGDPFNSTTWNPANVTRIQNHIDSRTCLSECCDLVVDCSNINDQTVSCKEDIPAPDESMIIIVESCGDVDIFPIDQGSGTPGNPVVRNYFITDEEGNIEQCTQTFTITGSEVVTTSIWPRTCIIQDFCVKGDYNVCAPATASSLVLEFWHNGVLQLSLPATLNGDGTWTFCDRLHDLVDLGLSFGTWYDVVPVLTLSNGSVITGSEYKPNQNDDLYFADQSDPVVTVNTSPTNANPHMPRICEGDPLYYHGVDPLSANHFSALRRRPIGSSFPFTNYQGFGWVGASLNNYNGDLLAQYPASYFVAGYEYELYIAVSNNDPDVCITWTPVKTVFEIIDCCEPNFTLEQVPDCVSDGAEFTVTVVIEGPFTGSDIQDIYSSYPNFTYVSHLAISYPGILLVEITFVSNSCTCEGEMLVFDITLNGCSEPIWIMTENLPCCTSECGKTEVVDWNAEDCIIVNGKPARPFCLEVQSVLTINDVIAATNDATCQVELEGLTVSGGAGGAYTICGYMVFQDPACTGHAVVTLTLDTDYGCCTIERPFSFPGGCDIDEECLSAAPNIEVIYGTSVHVVLDIPQGQTVTVTDHITGNTNTETVGNVDCGPFAIDQNGTIYANDCNGIRLTGPEGLDCRKEKSGEGDGDGKGGETGDDKGGETGDDKGGETGDGKGGETGETKAEEDPSFLYHFEITWGNCTWILIGDYCDEFIVYPSKPQLPDDKKEERSSEVESIANSITGEISVFPNPIGAEGMLTFDLTNLKTEVKEINITDLSGKTMESFQPIAGQKVFEHRLESSLQHGMYFVIVHLNDGTISSTRLVVTE